MVCTYVILGILAMSLCVYVCIVVEDMYTCTAGNFGIKCLCLCLCCCIWCVHTYDWGFSQRAVVFMFVLVYRVCTHARLEILATSVCAYFCVVVESMY